MQDVRRVVSSGCEMLDLFSKKTDKGQEGLPEPAATPNK